MLHLHDVVGVPTTNKRFRDREKSFTDGMSFVLGQFAINPFNIKGCILARVYQRYVISVRPVSRQELTTAHLGVRNKIIRMR